MAKQSGKNRRFAGIFLLLFAFISVFSCKNQNIPCDGLDPTCNPGAFLLYYDIIARQNTITIPSGVAANGGNAQVILSWNAVEGAKTYTIYWNTNGSPSKASNAIRNITGSAYTHGNLTNGTTYYYVVAAKDDYYEGDISTTVSATPQ